MLNFYMFGKLTLQKSKSSLSSCSIRCSSRKTPTINYVPISTSKSDERSRKEKHLRYRKCCQSEPNPRQAIQNNLGDTPLLLTALNAVEILDSATPKRKGDDRNRSEAQSLLESINFITANPSRRNISSNKTPKQEFDLFDEDRHVLYAKGANSDNHEGNEDRSDPSESLGSDPNEDGDRKRSYIINVFLNDQKEKKSEEECLNVHVKDLDIKPEDMCVRKLTENIHKSYEEMDKVLNNDSNTISNEGKVYMTKKLEEIWKEVFKQSEVEKHFAPLEAKDGIEENQDEELEEMDLKGSVIAPARSNKVLEVDEKIRPKRNRDEEDEERLSREESYQPNPSLIPNSVNVNRQILEGNTEAVARQDPVVMAAQIDEAIKKNLLYKKNKNKRKIKSTTYESDENTDLVERIQQKEQEKLLLKRDRNVKIKMEPPKVTPIQIDEILEMLSQGIEAKVKEDKKEAIQMQQPVVASTALKNEIPKKEETTKEVDENVISVTTLKKTNKDQLCKDFIDKHTQIVSETAPPKHYEQVYPKSQDTFDPEPALNELNNAMLEKSLIEEQINKYKHVNVAKKQKPDLSRLNVPQSVGKSRKVEVVEIMAPEDNEVKPESTRPVPLALGNRLKHYNQRTQKQIEDVINLAAPSQSDNTIKRMVSFCKGLFKDEQFSVRLPKFFKQDEFIDRQIRPKKLFSPENTTINMQYSSFVQSTSTPEDENKEKKKVKPKKTGDYKIAPMVRTEELFGTQQMFQQKCGIRERMLPSYESNVFKGNQRKLSYFTTNCVYPKVIDIVGNTSVLVIRQHSSKDADDTAKKDDPCSKVDENAKLESCKSADCKSECDDDDDGETNKCESPEDIKKIESGVVGCTSKCLANRVPDEPADPEPIEEPSDEDLCDPRYKTQVKPVDPRFDIMDQIGQLVNNDKGEEIECYYGDNGYQNLEYFKFYKTSFYDIHRHLSSKRNPQPDPFAHKRPKKKAKDACKT